MHLNSKESGGSSTMPVSGSTEIDAIELMGISAGHGIPVAKSVPEAVTEPEDDIVDEPTSPRSPIRSFTVLAALFCTLFIAALNSTIVATALPTIVSALDSASGYSWVGGAYLLASGAAAPIWVKLSDIWGRKPILLLAVALYFISSIVCAVSTTMKMLIVGRSFQGISGGGLLQLVTITISDLYSMRERSLYLGLLEIMWGIAGGVGPILGGVFAQYVSWRWIFWINLPICFGTFMLLFFFLDVHNPKTPLLDGLKAIDWFGSLSIVGFMLMLLLGLDFGGTVFPWNSATVICLIVFGVLMSIFFIFSEKKLAKYPIMPLELFTRRETVACLLVTYMHEFLVIAADYYLPLYFQAVKSASPSRSGVLLLPSVLMYATMGLITGIIIHRTGYYIPLIRIGMVLVTLGAGLFIDLRPATTVGAIVAFQIVFGIGAGLLFEPPIIAIQAAVTQDATATATASIGFSRSLALAMSIVIGGVVFQNGMNRAVKTTLVEAGLSPDMLHLLTGEHAAANVDIVARISDPAQKEAVRAAFATSLSDMWIMYVCVGAVGIVASLGTRHKVLSKVHQETKTGLKKDK